MCECFALLTGSIAIFVKLIVDPFGVLAHLRDLVCDFKNRIAQLKLRPVRILLQKNVRLDCHQYSLLNLLIIFESDLEFVHDIKDSAVASTV